MCADLQSLPRWIVYNELVFTSKEYVRCTSEIKPGMLYLFQCLVLANCECHGQGSKSKSKKIYTAKCIPSSGIFTPAALKYSTTV